MNNFEGKAIIELTDVETGETEVVESHNFMTNAIANALNHYIFNLKWPNPNIFLNRDEYQTHMPTILKFFQGLYIYDKNLGDDPNTIFAPAGAELTGVGDINTTVRSQDFSRGVYNTNLSGEYVDPDTETRTGYKFVWDFNQDQANGQIGSLCLTTRTGSVITQGGKYSSATADNFPNTGDFYRQWWDDSTRCRFRPWVDFTGWASNDSRRPVAEISRIALMHIDWDRSTAWTLNDSREMTNCAGRYASGSEEFKESLFYKKTLTLLECRYPFSKYSVFCGTPDSYSGAYPDLFTKLGTKTLNMPTELASIIDTALARGSTYQYYAAPFSTNDSIYIFLHIDEGFGTVSGIPNGGHLYIWKINCTDWTSTYYVIENTLDENICHIACQYGSTDTYSTNYFLSFTPSIAKDKYMVVMGATTKKMYVLNLEDPSDIKTVKYGYDKTTEYITTLDRTYMPTPELYRDEQCFRLEYGENTDAHVMQNYYQGGLVAMILDPVTGYIYRQYTYEARDAIGTGAEGCIRQYIKHTPVYLTFYNKTYWDYRYGGNSQDWFVGLGMDPTFLSTINNLPTTITKSDTQTMRVTYIVNYKEEN